MKFIKHLANQRLHLLAVALMVGTLVLDVGVLEIRYLVPDSVVPSDSNFVSNPAPNGEMLVRLADEEQKEKEDPCELIFIGASNVEFWDTEGLTVWNKYYAPRHAFNFGVRGDKTENVLWRFDHIDLSKLKPKAAVIFVGINNYADSPRDVAVGVKAVIKKTQSVFPGISILVVSITPRGLNDDDVGKANKMIKGYADNKTVFYIDLFSKIEAAGKDWPGLKADRTHFTVVGYQMWADEMEPTLEKILGDGPMTYSASVGAAPAKN
jgi:beta-glucosidase